MASKRNAIVAYLTTNGYHFTSSARNGYDVYRGRNGHEVNVPHHTNDNHAAEIHREVDKALGITAPKRSSSKSKSRARAKAERERAAIAKRKAAADAIAAEIEASIGEATEARRLRDSQLGGLARNLTNREVRVVSREVEQREWAARQAAREMTEIPLYGARR